MSLFRATEETNRSGWGGGGEGYCGDGGADGDRREML